MLSVKPVVPKKQIVVQKEENEYGDIDFNSINGIDLGGDLEINFDSLDLNSLSKPSGGSSGLDLLPEQPKS